MLDQKKIDALAGRLFELMLGDENSEAEAMSAGIQALCMVAAFHSSTFEDLQRKMQVAARIGSDYIELNYETYVKTMKGKLDA